MIRRKPELSVTTARHSTKAFALLSAARAMRQAAETLIAFEFADYAKRARSLAKLADARRRKIMKGEPDTTIKDRPDLI